MAKCNVCEKISLFPERFGNINICKVCFLKINGFTWKRQYDKKEKVEKQRYKVLDNLKKHGFSQDVICAIDDFFINQINGMQSCDCCKQIVKQLETIGKANICKQCFKKINIPEWQQSEYEDNDEVEVNRQKILKIATKNNFPTVAIEGINLHFDSKIENGLVCSIDGGCGQTLKVFESHCILITDDDFQKEDMSVKYVKAIKRTQSGGVSFGSSATKALAFGVLMPGNTLLKAGARAVASAAISVAADKFIAGKGSFKVIKGSYQINYRNYSFADIVSCGDKENDVGFVRFAAANGNTCDDIVFFIDYFSYDSNKLEKISPVINKGIELAHQPQIVISSAQNQQTINSTADEILKYKNLLDVGAITQEEFDAKKKELLGL